MPYTLPQFNMPMSVFGVGAAPGEPPPLDLPFITGMMCQIYVNPRQGHSEGGNILNVFIRWSVIGGTVAHDDYMFFDETNGYYYKALALGHCHIGFPNEYRLAVCQPCVPDGPHTIFSGIAW